MIAYQDQENELTIGLKLIQRIKEVHPNVHDGDGDFELYLMSIVIRPHHITYLNIMRRGI